MQIRHIKRKIYDIKCKPKYPNNYIKSKWTKRRRLSITLNKKRKSIPAGPVLRARHFHSSGPVHSLVGELRSHKPRDVAKKKNSLL